MAEASFKVCAVMPQTINLGFFFLTIFLEKNFFSNFRKIVTLFTETGVKKKSSKHYKLWCYVRNTQDLLSFSKD